MAPIVHGLEEMYANRINFVYLDRDDPATEEFRRALGYQYQPEYYLIGPGGEVVSRWFGFVPPDAFIAAFEEALMQ
jgi:hypothetical protein